MKHYILSCITILSLLSVASAQNTSDLYEKQWKEIDSLLQRASLPKSAQAKVTGVYNQAYTQKNEAQVLKALAYRISIDEDIKDTKPADNITTLQQEISKAFSVQQKSMLQMMLALAYYNALRNQYWVIQGRQETLDTSNTDITTWTVSRFYSVIDSLFQASLAPADLLQKTDLTAYEAIIEEGNTRHLRPTLFDLMAHTILQQYEIKYYLERNKDVYELTNPQSLAQAQIFIQTDFPTSDKRSDKYHILQLYKQLIAFHLKDKSPDALIDVDLDRIKWAYENAAFANKDNLYLHALENITTSYPESTETPQAYFLMASYHSVKAGSYKPLSDTANRYEHLKAKAIIEKQLALNLPESEGKSNMKQLLTSITAPYLNTNIESINSPHIPFRLLISYNNISEVYGRIIRIDNSEYQSAYTYNLSEDKWKQILKTPVYRQFTQALPATGDYQQHSVEIKIEGLPPGQYILIAGNTPQFNYDTDRMVIQPFDVSAISYVRHMDNIFVLNRETGLPINNVKVQFVTNSVSHPQKTILSTDKNGMVNYPGPDYTSQDITFFTTGDTLSQKNIYYYYSHPNTSRQQQKQIKLYFFTDRGIYRPGQIIYFKAIAANGDGTSQPEAFYSKDSVKIALYNSAYTIIDSINITFNEFGSATGSFRIPQNSLSGHFTLRADYQATQLDGSVDIQVEEYKRPKFYIDFDTLTSTYSLNDTIVIKGNAKAYAGSNISNAKVSYTINRNATYPYPWLSYSRIVFPQSQTTFIGNGVITTNNDGSFFIKFKAVPDSSVPSNTQPVFHFQVEASVTDVSGETREQSTDVAISYQSLQINLNVPEEITAQDFTHVSADITNLSGKTISRPVYISISPLPAPDRLIRQRYWKAPDQYSMSKQEYIKAFPHDEYANESDMHLWPQKPAIISGTYIPEATDQQYPEGFKLPHTLPQGYYVIEASTVGEKGDTIKNKAWIQIINLKEKQLSSPKYEWSYFPYTTTLQSGDTAHVYIGSSAENVFVIQNSMQGNFTDTTYNYFRLEGGQTEKKMKLSVNDEGGTAISYAFVKHNRIYHRTIQIPVEYKNKTLQVQYKTFRQKSLPGSKETWSIQVKGEKGGKAAAELLTAMYDASLDQFRNNDWLTPAPRATYFYYTQWNSGSNFSNARSTGIYNKTDEDFFKKSYDRLLSGFYSYRAISPAFPASAAVRVRGTIQNDLNEVTIVGYSAQKQTAESDERMANMMIANEPPSQTATNNTPIQIRTNFSETAFFFPQLQADSSGLYTFTFTMPDALTKWKWQSLAHTKALAFGLQSEEVISQKPLMAQLNAPRFIRQGDKLLLTATISNLDTAIQSGNIRLELLDATTNQPVDRQLLNISQQQPFQINAGANKAFQFPVTIPADFTQPVTYRITATAGNFSDGEENTIPVLSNRMLVTETVPFLLKGNTTQSYTISKLVNNNSNTLKTESLTVEYTTNPVWQSVQSLPYLIEYPYECAEQTFNRIYANTLAAFIVNKNPQIRSVFEQWEKDNTSLKSNLEKNESLKQLLLEESPWVLAAANDVQRQKNVAQLFNMATINKNTSTALGTLQQLQSSDGGFSWFKGGYADRFITAYIVTGIGKLLSLNATSDSLGKTLRTIATKAINWLDQETLMDYYSWKKTDPKMATSYLYSLPIQYLFARSYFTTLPLNNDIAYQFLLKQAAKYWPQQNNYNKALIGVVLFRNNQQQLAVRSILPSILENAVEDPEKGMYWKDRNTCFWYPSPIEHQAGIMTLTAELSSQYTTPALTHAYNEMRNWLILNKQTNNWGSTIATAEAIHALLLTPDLLQSNKQVTIQLGNTTIQSGAENKQAGSGYFSKRLGADKITNKTGNITVTTHSTINATDTTNISYGAVYWQYFEDMDKITPSPGNPLSLSKKWFTEKQTTNGAVLDPITSNSILKVGDKVVVQIVIKSDRDMDYVHIKDMRASTMEPVDVLSTYSWKNGLGYYQTTRDASTNFFIDHLRKGTYLFSYPVYITNTGTFSAGIATAQCMYAAEFTSHSEGQTITVN